MTDQEYVKEAIEQTQREFAAVGDTDGLALIRFIEKDHEQALRDAARGELTDAMWRAQKRRRWNYVLGQLARGTMRRREAIRTWRYRPSSDRSRGHRCRRVARRGRRARAPGRPGADDDPDLTGGAG